MKTNSMLTTIKNITSDGDTKYIRVQLVRPNGFIIPIPGQYVELKSCGVRQYAVITDTDDTSLWFLIKRDGKLGQLFDVDDISAIDVELTTLLGHGFSLEGVNERHVICFAGGSGIAAIEPLITRLLDDNTHKTCTIFYAESDGRFVDLDVAARDDISVLKIKTEGVLRANPHESLIGMIAKLTDVVPINFPQRPIVFACGGYKFIERLKKELVPQFVDETDFRLNF